MPQENAGHPSQLESAIVRARTGGPGSYFTQSMPVRFAFADRFEIMEATLFWLLSERGEVLVFLRPIGWSEPIDWKVPRATFVCGIDIGRANHPGEFVAWPAGEVEGAPSSLNLTINDGPSKRVIIEFPFTMIETFLEQTLRIIQADAGPPDVDNFLAHIFPPALPEQTEQI